MPQDLVFKFIECQTIIMSPFIPHYAEHVWTMLGFNHSIMESRWPNLPPADPKLIRMSSYFEKVCLSRSSHTRIRVLCGFHSERCDLKEEKAFFRSRCHSYKLTRRHSRFHFELSVQTKENQIQTKETWNLHVEKRNMGIRCR